MAEQKINGTAFSWSSIRTVIFGRSIVGFDEINYEDMMDGNAVTGRGDIPYDSFVSNYKGKGDVSLHMGEVVALQRLLPVGMRLQEMEPFDIVITYNRNGLLVKDILRGCRFLNNSRGGKSGSSDAIKSKMNLFVLTIDWDVK